MAVRQAAWNFLKFLTLREDLPIPLAPPERTAVCRLLCAQSCSRHDVHPLPSAILSTHSQIAETLHLKVSTGLEVLSKGSRS